MGCMTRPSSVDPRELSSAECAVSSAQLQLLELSLLPVVVALMTPAPPESAVGSSSPSGVPRRCSSSSSLGDPVGSASLTAQSRSSADARRRCCSCSSSCNRWPPHSAYVLYAWCISAALSRGAHSVLLRQRKMRFVQQPVEHLLAVVRERLITLFVP